MKNLTFRDLAARIAKMSDEEKDMSVSVFVSDVDEYYPAQDVLIASDLDDVLDEGHPFIFA